MKTAVHGSVRMGLAEAGDENVRGRRRAKPANAVGGGADAAAAIATERAMRWLRRRVGGDLDTVGPTGRRP